MPPYFSPLAQWVEQWTFNPRVPGSSPGRRTWKVVNRVCLDTLSKPPWRGIALPRAGALPLSLVIDETPGDTSTRGLSHVHSNTH